MLEGLLAHLQRCGTRSEDQSVPRRVILNFLWVGGCVGGLMDLSEMLKKSLYLFPRRMYM